MKFYKGLNEIVNFWNLVLQNYIWYKIKSNEKIERIKRVLFGFIKS